MCFEKETQNLTPSVAVQLSIGAVRAKNAKNILLVILMDASFAMVMFYICGWAFAYGGSFGDEKLGNKFIGFEGFGLNNLPRQDWYMFFFQYTVCFLPATFTPRAWRPFCDSPSDVKRAAA